MKRNLGVWVLLLSVVLTTVGSVLKILHVNLLPEVLLALGMILFIVAMVMIFRGLIRRR